MAQVVLGMFLAIWIEGENFKTAPQGLERTVGLKAPASGGKVLYGGCLETKGSVVTYEFDLPADVPAGDILFRYARLHWKETMKPAAVELALSGPGGEVKKEIAFPDTKGWRARYEKDYKLLPVELGQLKKGKYELKLTSLSNDNSVTIDGFFVAAKNFGISDDELNRCCRIQISSDGYVGLPWPTVVFRQGIEPALHLAVRTFGGSTPQAGAVTLQAPDAAKPEALVALEGPRADLHAFIAGSRGDGLYSLSAEYLRPACVLRASPIFCGEFLSKFDDRRKAVTAFVADWEKKPEAASSRATPDLQHIVQYLQTSGKKFAGEPVFDNGTFTKGLAALEGIEAPDALIGDMRRALEQAEAMVRNLQAGKDAYVGLSGDLRRAYRSAADGNLVPYRVFVPDAYAKADKVPFIYMLHGGGGDEDTWADTEGGKILDILDERGYLAVMPKWHSRNRPWGDVLQLLELAMKEYPKIDPDRVYCTGVSMGGFGTYSLATEHPEKFAAVCCVSGTGDPSKVEKLKNVPLLIFQGGSDTVVPPAGAERVAAKMKELGYVVDLRFNPKYGHDYHAEEYLNLTLDFFDKCTCKK